MSKQKSENEIQRLQDELAKERELNAILKEELEKYSYATERLVRKIELDKILNHLQSSWNAATAADLLVDPNPVELSCSGNKVGTSLTYPVRVINILAIQSNGRSKEIYLKEPLKPYEGKHFKTKITFEKDGVDFDELLIKIQRRGDHLLRVQKSWAINIYHYQLNAKGVFHLKGKLRNESTREIDEIAVGSLFNEQLYKDRLFEIDKMKEFLKTALDNIKKGEEFQRKMEELGLSE